MNTARKPASAAVEYDGGHIRLYREIWEHVIKQCHSLVVLKILLLAESETLSARINKATGERPEFWRFNTQKLADEIGVTDRAIEEALAWLEKHQMIEREHPDRRHTRGGCKLRPDNFHAMPGVKPRTCKPREAAVTAPAPERRMVVYVGGNSTAATSAAMIRQMFPADILIGGEVEFAPSEVVPANPGSPGTLSIADRPDSSSPAAGAYRNETEAQTSSSGASVEPAVLDEAYLARFSERHARLYLNAGHRSLPSRSHSKRTLAVLAADYGDQFLDWMEVERKCFAARSPAITDTLLKQFTEAVRLMPRPVEPPAQVPLDPAEMERIDRMLAEPLVVPYAAKFQGDCPKDSPTVGVCWKCCGTGELHNLSDPDAFSPCTCEAGSKYRN
jgi:hypothetical protein